MSSTDTKKIIDMLLDDTAILDDVDKVNWSFPDDNFLESLLQMEENSDTFDEFLSTSEDFLSSAATSPTYDNAENSSDSDNLSFIPKSESQSPMSEPIDDTATKMELSYDSFVKEEIIDDDYEDDNYINTDKPNIEKLSIVQHPQLLKTTPRTVVISPKQSNGPISISKNLSKPVFVPINLSNVKTIKVINQNGKTINAEAFRRLQSINSGQKIFVRNNGTLVSKSMPIMKQNKVVASDCTSDESDSIYPRLHLTNEEKKLMEKEGIKLPSHYPLSKHQERDLKRIRRKIRNKISAQDSRKRKKEYVDGLEDRVKQCSDENNQLKKTVHSLQTENERLKAALKRLQNAIAPGGTAHPTTCLLVLMLSLALITAPNLRPTVSDEKDVMSIDGQESKIAVPGRSRNLLNSKSGSPLSSASLKDVVNMITNGSSADEQSNIIMAELGELLKFNGVMRNKDHDYSRSAMDDYYIPSIESDDNWTKAPKRSASSELENELLTSNVKRRRETEQVILVSSDEECY